jgi:excisionase family DNA binding protein
MQDVNEPADLLTSTQVAALLGVTGSTVRRYADTDRLACVVLPGGHRRFRRADVDALLAPAARTPEPENAA